jgi:hypothetical protein
MQPCRIVCETGMRLRDDDEIPSAATCAGIATTSRLATGRPPRDSRSARPIACLAHRNQGPHPGRAATARGPHTPERCSTVAAPAGTSGRQRAPRPLHDSRSARSTTCSAARCHGPRPSRAAAVPGPHAPERRPIMAAPAGITAGRTPCTSTPASQSRQSSAARGSRLAGVAPRPRRALFARAGAAATAPGRLLHPALPRYNNPMHQKTAARIASPSGRPPGRWPRVPGCDAGNGGTAGVRLDAQNPMHQKNARQPAQHRPPQHRPGQHKVGRLAPRETRTPCTRTQRTQRHLLPVIVARLLGLQACQLDRDCSRGAGTRRRVTPRTRQKHSLADRVPMRSVVPRPLLPRLSLDRRRFPRCGRTGSRRP